MYARVMTALIKPGYMEKMLHIYQSIITTAEKQKGFKDIILLTNTKTNKVMSISVWETEADMKAGENSGYLREKIASVAATCTFEGTPVTEYYEVGIFK